MSGKGHGDGGGGAAVRGDITIGTRGSSLALWQAQEAQRAIKRAFPDVTCRIRVVSTKGDRVADTPLETIGDKGLFTRELESALLAGGVDLCVHSMKDLPTELPRGCMIGAMLERGDPRDALVCGPRIQGARSLGDIPAGARLGTGSLRRTAQLRARHANVEPVPMRGNVDTRLRKARGDGYEGAVLAAAGLLRLGESSSISAYLPVDDMVPAVGQGAIGIEVRRGDARMQAVCRAIGHEPTERCVGIEREVLAALEGGCQAPIGVHARYCDGRLAVDATVLSADGSREARVRWRGAEDSPDVAGQVVRELEERGARGILADIAPGGHVDGGRRDATAATVYLVGAGPGDAGLLTLRGRELLERADAVVYDYLANVELLDYAPPGARRVYAGKRGFAAHIGQEELNGLLVRVAGEVAAQGGGTVVRLKGGDPFVFGRGGEEALALARAGVPFEVVPGVTSGIAAPAYAGIPVTHRGVSSTVTFVTGHEDPSKDATGIDWAGLARMARRGGTLCFYMGLRNLPLIARKLQSSGVDGAVPAALVSRGTTPRQRVLVASLADLPERAQGFEAPAMMLVGPVAALRDDLTWFERRPLFGKTVAVTRSRSQASALSSRLAALGARVVEFPAIAFEPPDNLAPLDAAIADLPSYDWVVFTSVNGVDSFFGRLAARAPGGPGRPADARALAGARVAAIGPATARRLDERGIRADVVPGEYRGEAVFQAMERACAHGGRPLGESRALIPRAQVARDALPDLLRRAGARVDVVAAYKTVRPEESRVSDFAAMLRGGEVDAVTFTSSSTARNLIGLLGDDAALLKRVDLFSIGPVTSRALEDAGLRPVSEAAEYTIAGLVDALAEAYRENRGGR